VKRIRSLYLNNRFFLAPGIIAACFITCFILADYFLVPKALFFIAIALVFTDAILLFRTKTGMQGYRLTPEKLSNGDENELKIHLENFYPFVASVRVIDEIPHQFQKRDLNFYLQIAPGETKTVRYYLRPVKRGEYSFGAVNVFVSSPLGLLSRRFRFSANKVVPVYPSYIQMRRYELLAISNRLTETGVKKIRRVGHNLEFELIREYVNGDDFRTINWKATARKERLMVNHFQDERSQQVYSLIDKGRVMRMPFDGMSLLDYAINASLVISNIAIKKSDKAGIMTFQDKIGTLVPASRNSNQMGRILEVLYRQKTAYRETDFSVVHNYIRRKITQRSLLLLYTNFESMYSLHRQMPYLQALSKLHLLVVIFFENTEVKKLIEQPAGDLREVYHKAIAEKLTFEKRLVVKELKKHGIHAVLTTPQHLTVATINKYLELKARGLI
jgi:uncharacterized protein (DUF58 family)